MAADLARVAFEQYFKGLDDAQQQEAQDLEALTEQPLADDEAPPEREALHPRYQAMLERSLAYVRAAMRHGSDRPGAKRPRITSGFWRGVL
jgi:hypothetical protein